MRRQLMLALVMSAWVPVVSAGTVTISDNMFNDTNWSSRRDGSSNFTGNHGVDGARFPLGGNPGVYRELRNFGATFGFGPARPLIGWHFYEAASYDPSLGAIDSITVSEDVLLSEGPIETGRLALRQDGILFRSKHSYGIDALNVWESRSLTDLAATDFEAFFNGSFLANGHPDFSEGAAPIIFGVYRGSSVEGRRPFQ